MDSLSHGLWSYAIWKSAPLAGLAVLFGMMPDAVSFIPRGAHNIKRGAHILSEEALPRWISKWERVTFPITHSLLVSLAACAFTFIVFGNHWWTLAWPLHVMVDIITHPREHGTPFLWPISHYKVHSFYWEGRPFLIGNAAALLLVYALWVV